MPQLYRLVSVAILLVQACHHYVPIPPEPQAFERESTGYVELVRRTGENVRLSEPSLEDGSIVGRMIHDRGPGGQMRYVMGERVEIPLSEIESIRVRKLNVARTVYLSLGIGLFLSRIIIGVLQNWQVD